MSVRVIVVFTFELEILLRLNHLLSSHILATAMQMA